MTAPLTSIAVLGNGLAGLLAAHRLARTLPDAIDIRLWGAADAGARDHLYGTAVGPDAYNFLLELGLGEPELMPATDTTFSLGTHFKGWGEEARDWVQAFHQPLPVMGGVEFHQYAARAKDSYPDYVMSVAAARRGAFAHPPEGQKTPLAALEYGYHLLPEQLRGLLRDTLPDRVRVVSGEDASLEADWIIDTRDRAAPEWRESRTITVSVGQEPADGPVGVVREVSGGPDGWTARTPLRRMTHTLTVGADGASLPLGRSDTPWTGNRLVLGLAAGALSPLTTAPLTLLIRDLQRLAELVPMSTDMRVEAREYNRRFRNDYDHALLFERAFFPAKDQGGHPPRLAHKIAQFKSRGALVQYDLEPFGPTDWLLLHLGMGRNPARHDVLADRVPREQLHRQLATMRRAVETVAAKLPPAAVYHRGLLDYLGKQR